jgi:hypothetical protein
MGLSIHDGVGAGQGTALSVKLVGWFTSDSLAERRGGGVAGCDSPREAESTLIM